MLREITIQNFAIAEELTAEFSAGMTVITGETGAGKSIMLDALGLCVGDRADARTVRQGASKADISARFDVQHLTTAQAWLAARELENDERECILRRVVSADGRSKAFINGAPATLADCAELGQLLVDIHSQHAHQSLLRTATQRQLLDAYAGTLELAANVATLSSTFKTTLDLFNRLSHQSDADGARRDLLAYQVSELDELALRPDEFTELESEHKLLANAGFLIDSSVQAADGCEDVQSHLAKLRQLMDDDRHDARAVSNIRELLNAAEIQLEEARAELRHYTDSLELDPERLATVESRLDTINRLARKHRVIPEQLFDHHQRLSEELETLSGGDQQLDALQTQLAALRNEYQQAANRLTKARQKAAKGLSKRVMATLKQLSMERCEFTIQLSPRVDSEPNARGAEDVEFLISTNPGTPAGPLKKIASGGELSRISLALQVAASENVTAPTMIFDEVDVGIGGGVAEVVGQLLRQLAEKVQVICVTHLGQVAAQGQQHLQVSKGSRGTHTHTALTPLTTEARIQEIARMVGGIDITDSSLAHAKDMLGRAEA